MAAQPARPVHLLPPHFVFHDSLPPPAKAPAGDARCTADIELDCGSRQTAQTVWQAIRLEVSQDGTGQVDGQILRLHLAAPDPSGLRASLNSALRLGDAALRVAQRRP